MPQNYNFEDVLLKKGVTGIENFFTIQKIYLIIACNRAYIVFPSSPSSGLVSCYKCHWALFC